MFISEGSCRCKMVWLLKNKAPFIEQIDKDCIFDRRTPSMRANQSTKRQMQNYITLGIAPFQSLAHPLPLPCLHQNNLIKLCHPRFPSFSTEGFPKFLATSLLCKCWLGKVFFFTSIG